MNKKRIKKLEYSWIFKGSFTVGAYTVKHNNGKTYIVYAHDFNDMEMFLTRLKCFEKGIMYRQKDCDTHFEKRMCVSYMPNKKGDVLQKPFWYRGRVYEVLENEE